MKIAKNVSKLGTELVYDIFAKTKKVARVDFESVANEKSLKKKSLRGFVTKNRIPLENLNVSEKVRQSLRAGL